MADVQSPNDYPQRDLGRPEKTLPDELVIAVRPGEVGVISTGKTGIPNLTNTELIPEYSGSAGSTRTADPAVPGEKTAPPFGNPDSQRLGWDLDTEDPAS